MSNTREPARVVIMGAAGRDFHNFNQVYRDDPGSRVIAFTATQIPQIADRCYPAALAGAQYPDGIPIVDESELETLCEREGVDQVVFAYSDVGHEWVMHRASIALAAGADFVLLGPRRTMLKAGVPVIATSAVRTGCGKSQTTRWLSRLLNRHGLKAAVIRHPMPYGDLARQAVQRFACRADLDAAHCTIEEREEYEPHLAVGNVVYAGVDYAQIVLRAEQEADVILWDGGNNDTPFYKPDLHIVLFDPHRAGHELLYFPGETNMIMAYIAIINKVDSAPAQKVWQVRKNIEEYAPGAQIVLAESSLVVKKPEMIQGKRVLVIEDGPTLTHGEMPFGAGIVAAEAFNAAEIIDPRPYAVGSLNETFAVYPHIGNVIPAMGYTPDQISDLETTINKADCDLVLFATPIHLPLVLNIKKPTVRVRYEYQDHGEPTLENLISARLT